jgi:hypothetical protein
MNISLLYLTIFAVVSASKIDLGVGNFFKTVCSPSHPTSLSGQSDYICTLKERDFYPQSIGNAVQGLKVMGKADMVKELQIVLAKNILKLKREAPEEFKAYKSELGGDEALNLLVKNLILVGWATDSFDYGFQLYEEFELDSRDIINKATPPKLIERLAKIKPKLAVKLFNSFPPHEKISALLNDPTGLVLDEFVISLNARRSNLKSVFTEFAPHICQKSQKEIPTQTLNLIVEHFEENEANLIKAIIEICYGKDTEKAIEIYKKNPKEELIVNAVLKSNNHKTTLEALKLENKTEILNILNLFSSEKQKEQVISLLKQSNFVELERNDLLKIIIENGLESNDFESGVILSKAINNLQTPIQVNLHIKGLGKVFINSDVKSAIKENYSLIKFKFTSLSLATLIKEDHLFNFIKEFGNEKFFNNFQVDQPQVLLTYLNLAEDFNTAYQLFNLKSGNKLYESDFLAENLSSALEMFAGDSADKIFLMMRRPHVEYIISKFKAELFPQLPENFVQILKETQEL